MNVYELAIVYAVAFACLMACLAVIPSDGPRRERPRSSASPPGGGFAEILELSKKARRSPYRRYALALRIGRVLVEADRKAPVSAREVEEAAAAGEVSRDPILSSFLKSALSFYSAVKRPPRSIPIMEWEAAMSAVSREIGPGSIERPIRRM